MLKKTTFLFIFIMFGSVLTALAGYALTPCPSDPLDRCEIKDKKPIH